MTQQVPLNDLGQPVKGMPGAILCLLGSYNAKVNVEFFMGLARAIVLSNTNLEGKGLEQSH